jgi:GNAT superfamily N-acetyltransferase
MRVSSVEVTPVSAHGPAAWACLERYFEELAARFPEGFDWGSDGGVELDDYLPPAGVFLVAQILGEPAGCGALRTFSPGVGEIKRMWVSPEVRGLGVGRRLLEELECAARVRSLHAVRLDTHAALAQALQLYRSSGYREIPRFNDNPYAHHWFEKTLD